MSRTVSLLPDTTLCPLQRGRLATSRLVTADVADRLGVAAPLVQVVRDSVTGVWGTAASPVMNLDVGDLDTFDELALLGVLAHEVGHVAAGHLDKRAQLPRLCRRRRRRLHEEMEANKFAVMAVGGAPLVAAYLTSVNRSAAQRGGGPLTAQQVIADEAWMFPEADDAAELLRRVASTCDWFDAGRLSSWGEKMRDR